MDLSAAWKSTMEGFSRDFGKEGTYAERMKGPRRYYGPAGGHSSTNSTKLTDMHSGIDSFNRNSAIGLAHNSISSAFGGSTGAKFGVGAGMAGVGMTLWSGESNIQQNHSFIGGTLKTGTLAAGLGAALDPALVGKMFSSGMKAGEKVISKFPTKTSGEVPV
jgi:hypothetical protein